MNTSRHTHRVGVVGHGVGARLHRPALHAIPNVRVVEVQMPQMSGHQPLAASEGLLAEELDLLVIGTPPFAHRLHSLLALSARVPTLCEKPVGLDAATPVELEAASQRAGVAIGANYQLRFDRTITEVRQRIASEGCEAVTIRYLSGARTALSGAPSWYQDVTRGGGILAAIGSHLVDALHFLGLELAEVMCRGRTGGMNRLALTGVTTTAACVSLHLDGLASEKEFSLAWRAAGTWSCADLISGKIVDGIRPESAVPDRDALTSSGRPWRPAFEALVRRVAESNFDLHAVRELASMREARHVHDVLRAAAMSVNTGRAHKVRDELILPPPD